MFKSLNAITDTIMWISIIIAFFFFLGVFIIKKKKIKIRAKAEDDVDVTKYKVEDIFELYEFDDIYDTYDENGRNMGAIIVDIPDKRFLAVLSTVGTEWGTASAGDKASIIRSEIARTNIINKPMQVWQYSTNTDMSYQIDRYQKKYDELLKKVLDKQADFEEMKAISENVPDEEYDIYYQEVLKLRKELYSLDNERKNVEELLNYIKINSSEGSKQEACICYVIEWVYNPLDFTDALDSDSVWKQAVKELKTKCDKHISSLNGSSVYAKRMTKTEIIEASRKHTAPLSADSYDIKKIAESNVYEMIVESDSLMEYEKATVKEEKEIEEIEKILFNNDPVRAERYKKMLEEKISYPFICSNCSKKQYIQMSNDQYTRFKRYLKGEDFIQNLLYDLSAEEREMIITGLCSKCEEKIIEGELS